MASIHIDCCQNPVPNSELNDPHTVASRVTFVYLKFVSIKVVDVVLHTSCKERLLELLRDDCTLRYPGSGNNGGVIISGQYA